MNLTQQEKIEAAKAFGDHFGWKLSDKPFGIDVLARNGVWSTDYWLRGSSQRVRGRREALAPNGY